MSTSTVGPVPLSRVWSGSKVLAEDVVGDDLADVLDLHAGANAWWVLDRSSDYARDELRRLAAALDLDQLAISDLTADDHRAKYEQVGSTRLVVTSAVSVDADRVELRIDPISLLVTDRALVCLADSRPGLDPARLLTAKAPVLGRGDLDTAMRLLVHAVVDSYAAAVTWLETASDALADVLFEERPLTRSQQLQAFRLRTILSQLRRITEPMRAVLIDLVDDAGDEGSPSARQWTLLQEKHQRTADAADRLRDALASIFETSLALADVQLNVIMKKLTGWAAIIAVPTLVSGFVGMNVAFPLSGTVVGFWVYFVIMLASALGLWWVFRRRDWV